MALLQPQTISHYCIPTRVSQQPSQTDMDSSIITAVPLPQPQNISNDNGHNLVPQPPTQTTAPQASSKMNKFKKEEFKIIYANVRGLRGKRTSLSEITN